VRKYIRHHNGVIHSVDAEVFFVHLAQARMIRYEDKTIEPAREALPAEVAAYWERQGFVYLPESDEALTPDEAAARAPKASAKPADKPADKPAAKDA
jgi:hypothetical protein